MSEFQMYYAARTVIDKYAHKILKENGAFVGKELEIGGIRIEQYSDDNRGVIIYAKDELCDTKCESNVVFVYFVDGDKGFFSRGKWEQIVYNLLVDERPDRRHKVIRAAKKILDLKGRYGPDYEDEDRTVMVYKDSSMGLIMTFDSEYGYLNAYLPYEYELNVVMHVEIDDEIKIHQYNGEMLWDCYLLDILLPRITGKRGY